MKCHEPSCRPHVQYTKSAWHGMAWHGCPWLSLDQVFKIWREISDTAPNLYLHIFLKLHDLAFVNTSARPPVYKIAKFLVAVSRLGLFAHSSHHRPCCGLHSVYSLWILSAFGAEEWIATCFCNLHLCVLNPKTPWFRSPHEKFEASRKWKIPKLVVFQCVPQSFEASCRLSSLQTTDLQWKLWNIHMQVDIERGTDKMHN